MSHEKVSMSELLKKRGFIDKGDYWSGPCPVHKGDNQTACTIYKDTKVWRCWTRECHSNPSALWDALKIDKDKVYTPDQYEKEEIALDDLPELMTKAEVLKRFCVPSPFMISRGFSKSILKEFYIGACFNAKDFLVNRTVVPMFNNDIIIGWSARAHNPHAKSKWMHSKGLPRSRYLYNVDSFDKSGVFLTEGPLDCVKLSEAGFKSCGAIMGSFINNGQVEILKNKQIKKVILLFDNDEAGEKATAQSIKKLSEFEVIVPKISGNDPGEMTVDQLRKELERFL